MKRWLLVLAACKSSPSDDCKIVHDDPEHAMARISERHPGNPVLASETIERCLAPSGDDCERLAKILPALPRMMGTPQPLKGDIAKLCQGAPLELRHCLFPSYALAHGEECARAQQRSLDHIEITPRPEEAVRPVIASDEPPAVAIAIDRDGVTVTTKKGAHKKPGALDADWLEAELRAGRDPGRNDAELKVAPGVPYQTTIAAMDIAVKVGLVDVGLDSGGTGSAAPNPGKSGPDALKDAPVVIITKTELTVAGKPIATVEGLAKGSGTIAALAAVLPHSDQAAILQADESTDMNVINRVVNTLKGAGYDNILFAVKNR